MTKSTYEEVDKVMTEILAQQKIVYNTLLQAHGWTDEEYWKGTMDEFSKEADKIPKDFRYYRRYLMRFILPYHFYWMWLSRTPK